MMKKKRDWVKGGSRMVKMVRMGLGGRGLKDGEDGTGWDGP